MPNRLLRRCANTKGADTPFGRRPLRCDPYVAWLRPWWRADCRSGVGCSAGRSKGELERCGIAFARRIGESARKAQRVASRQAGFDKACMVGIGIVGPQNHGRKTFVAAAFAIEAVARDEDVACGRRVDRCPFIANRERFQIRAVGEEDATVFRSKGMDASRRNDETQRSEPCSRHLEAPGRQNEMVKRMRAGGWSVGHRGAVCIIPQSGSRLFPVGGRRLVENQNRGRDQLPATTSAE